MHALMVKQSSSLSRCYEATHAIQTHIATASPLARWFIVDTDTLLY